MEAIVQIISSVGFPIAMCMLMGYWVKTTHDDHREDYKRLQESHTAESKELTQAINNNTLVVQQLIDKMGDDIDE